MDNRIFLLLTSGIILGMGLTGCSQNSAPKSTPPSVYASVSEPNGDNLQAGDTETITVRFTKNANLATKPVTFTFGSDAQVNFGADPSCTINPGESDCQVQMSAGFLDAAGINKRLHISVDSSAITLLTPTIPFNIAPRQASHLYTANYDGNNIVRCDIDNTSGALSNCVVTAKDHFSGPSGIAAYTVGSATHVYVTNFNGNSVTSCTVNHDAFSLTCSAPTANTLFDKPDGIAIHRFADKTYAYIANHGKNDLLRCPINVDGSFDVSDCASVAKNVFSTGNPSGISFHTIGTTTYLYVGGYDDDNQNASVPLEKCTMTDAGLIQIPSCEPVLSQFDAALSNTALHTFQDGSTYIYLTNRHYNGNSNTFAVQQCSVDQDENGFLSSCGFSDLPQHNGFVDPNFIAVNTLTSGEASIYIASHENIPPLLSGTLIQCPIATDSLLNINQCTHVGGNETTPLKFPHGIFLF